MDKLVLVVEDDADICNILVEMLHDAGYKAMGAENGVRALELVSALNFNLVITDLAMPQMDGNALLKRLSESSPAVPVIVTTANPKELEPSPVVRSTIAKPFDLEQLLVVVEKYIL